MAFCKARMFMKEKNHYSIKEIKKRMIINAIFKM